jgi:GNAT superfamily N-acetyltransferase
VYRQLAPDEFDARAEWQGRAIARWTLALHVNDQRTPAAWATFGRGAGDAWRMETAHVRRRYRGAGLEDRLMRQADGILARDG